MNYDISKVRKVWERNDPLPKAINILMEWEMIFEIARNYGGPEKDMTKRAIKRREQNKIYNQTKRKK